MARHSIIEQNRQPLPFFLSLNVSDLAQGESRKASALACAPLWWLERPPKAVGRSRYLPLAALHGGHGDSKGDACSQSMKLNMVVTD